MEKIEPTHKVVITVTGTKAFVSAEARTNSRVVTRRLKSD